MNTFLEVSNWEVFKTEFCWNVQATWLHAWGSLYTSHEGEQACSTCLSAARKAATVEGGLQLGLVSPCSG
jgi:hypothetical protein